MYRFKEVRKKHGLTQEDVAEKLGHTRASYTNIENGKRDPDTEMLIGFSRIFDVSVDYLLRLSDNERSDCDSMSPDEHQLISCYRKMNGAGKSMLLDNARVFSGNPEMQEAHLQKRGKS